MLSAFRESTHRVRRALRTSCGESDASRPCGDVSATPEARPDARKEHDARRSC